MLTPPFFGPMSCFPTSGAGARRDSIIITLDGTDERSLVANKVLALPSGPLSFEGLVQAAAERLGAPLDGARGAQLKDGTVIRAADELERALRTSDASAVFRFFPAPPAYQPPAPVVPLPPPTAPPAVVTAPVEAPALPVSNQLVVVINGDKLTVKNPAPSMLLSDFLRDT